MLVWTTTSPNWEETRSLPPNSFPASARLCASNSPSAAFLRRLLWQRWPGASRPQARRHQVCRSRLRNLYPETMPFPCPMLNNVYGSLSNWSPVVQPITCRLPGASRPPQRVCPGAEPTCNGAAPRNPPHHLPVCGWAAGAGDYTRPRPATASHRPQAFPLSTREAAVQHLAHRGSTVPV